MMFLLLFIIIIFCLLVYSWINYNNKGRYIASVTIIVLLLISSITIYKYQNINNDWNWIASYNYNEFAGTLTLHTLGDSKLEQNEKLNRQISLLLNRIIELDAITSRSSLFASEPMEEAFLELKEAIYSIHAKIKEENYSLEKSMILDLSKYLAEIGNLLGTKIEYTEHNILGVPTRKIEYEEDRINKVRELINEINKVLDLVE